MVKNEALAGSACFELQLASCMSVDIPLPSPRHCTGVRTPGAPARPVLEERGSCSCPTRRHWLCCATSLASVSPESPGPVPAATHDLPLRAAGGSRRGEGVKMTLARSSFFGAPQLRGEGAQKVGIPEEPNCGQYLQPPAGLELFLFLFFWQEAKLPAPSPRLRS